MLIPSRSFDGRRSVRGFSLIEMMVSIVIGMIVVAGAITLIVAIDRSNSETIHATRVNQELRALASVIGDEIKRARRLHDPVANVGQGATSHAAFDYIDTSTAGCIVYGYQDVPLSDGTANNEYENYYQAIYRTTSGALKFAQLKKTKTEMDDAAAAAGAGFDPTSLALGCTDSANAGATIVTLASPQLNVTALSFKCVTLVAGNVVTATSKSASCSQIDMAITAKLASGDTYEKNIPHTYVQQVFVRSGAVKTS
jgi:Tfp pilus assembly protein PilW